MVHFHQTYDDKLSIQDRNQSFWPTDLGCEYQFICQQQSQKSAAKVWIFTSLAGTTVTLSTILPTVKKKARRWRNCE